MAKDGNIKKFMLSTLLEMCGIISQLIYMINQFNYLSWRILELKSSPYKVPLPNGLRIDGHDLFIYKNDVNGIFPSGLISEPRQ